MFGRIAWLVTGRIVFVVDMIGFVLLKLWEALVESINISAREGE